GDEFDEMHVTEGNCLLTELYKKSPDQELVVINEVIDCQENEGYDSYENQIVKEVNGVVINKLSDVIKAIEENNNNFHHIKVSNGNIMIIKNMSKAEHNTLLQKWHIKQDCSDDLVAFRNSLHQRQVQVDNHLPAAERAKEIEIDLDDESDESEE